MSSLSHQDISRVIQIIQQLYSGQASTEQQQQLQSQLVHAQRTEASWELVGPLLSSEDVNVRFFGAHTAAVKITRDWDTLPEELHVVLLESLLGWTSSQVALGSINAVVIRKLFVALSALILRLSPKRFSNPLSLLLTTLSTPTASSSPTSALQYPLEFFQILIEEVTRTPLVGSHKIEVHEMLKQEQVVVVGVCTRAIEGWQAGSGGNDGEREMLAGVRCLEGWIGWGLSGDLLSPLLPLLISLLAHPTSLPAASSCMQEILTASVLKDGRGTKVLTDPLLVWIDGVGKEVSEACFASGMLDESSEAICKLLIALGEHSSDYLALHLAQPQVQTYFSLMLGYTGFEGYYGIDEEISEVRREDGLPLMCLPFWSLFQESLTESPHIDRADTPNPPPEWSLAKLIFAELVQRLRRKSMYPNDAEEMRGWMKDQVDRFKVYRNDVGDAIVTAYYVLRRDMLSYFVDSLSSSLSSLPLATDASSSSSSTTTATTDPTNWAEIEATLHCLRCAQEAIPMEEIEFLPRVWSEEILGRLPRSGESATRKTTLTLIDEYSSWFHSHPTHVLPVISYIVPALEVPSLCSAAANALKHLCDLCRGTLTSHIGEFGGLYSKVQERIDPIEKAKVLEAITSVVQALPPLEAVEPVLSLTAPIISKLTQALSAVSQLPEEARDLALHQILSLTAIAKGLAPADDFFSLDSDEEGGSLGGGGTEEEAGSKKRMEEAARGDGRLEELRGNLMRCVNGMIEVWPIDVEVASSISTFLRALTPPQTTASPSLLSLDPEPLLQIIASAARQHLSSVWLSLAETLVGRLAPPLGFSDSFGPEAQRTQGLVREISGVLLRSGIDALREGEDKMSANPDLVEGLFKFASAVVARFPVALLSPPHDLASDLIQVSLVGLSLQERYSVQAITGFLTTTISRSRSPDFLLEAVNPLLRTYGRALVDAIVRGAGGGSPRSVIPHLAELLSLMVTRLPEECVGWLGAVLSIEGYPDPRATKQVKDKLRDSVLKSRTIKRVREALNEFALVSRGLENSAYGGALPL